MPLSNLANNFIFGAATSAYQIEGAINEDGRGPSIWDDFSCKKGKVVGNDSGETACDHYHRYAEDVQLMSQLNLQAYRFSISWSRILPQGRGQVNQAGVDFYKRLIDKLLAANITPFATLFHWDMPTAIYQLNGGFIHRDTCEYFADYTEVVLNALGDRVKHWITINEPFEHAAFGHLLGSHAPGKHSMKAFLQVMHHQLLGHGAAIERIRSISPDAKAGITLSLTPILPVTESPKDQWAANFGNQLLNKITLDPLYKQQYPAELQQKLAWFWPKIEHNDLTQIAQKTDFVGVNHYNCEYAQHRWYIPFLNSWISGSKPGIDLSNDGKVRTAMGWEIRPQGMADVLCWLREDYGNPAVYITENGSAFDDILEKGKVHDIQRINYFKAYLQEVSKARTLGSDLRGYFAWSLLDNFEWATGFSKRFGLIHVDYTSQQRTIKDSGHWYQQLISQLQAQKGSA